MAYSPTWTNANASGRLDPVTHAVRLTDPQEVADAVNRRRRVTYAAAQDCSGEFTSGAAVRYPPIINTSAPPFEDLRSSITADVLNPTTGTLGGSPATPSAMTWLWPEADADENKTIVHGFSGVGAGEVGLMQKLNGTDNWTDPVSTFAAAGVRAVHFNELRQSVEWIRRGRWEMPVYLNAGILSTMPDDAWANMGIANDGFNELRALGEVVLITGDSPARGPTNATALASSQITVQADYDCTIEVYHCLRPYNAITNLPTWNHYDPDGGLAWDTAGCSGAADRNYIGSIALNAGTPGSLSNAALQAALQDMIDGAEPNFMIRRSDSGWESFIEISADLTVDFELDSPPN